MRQRERQDSSNDLAVFLVMFCRLVLVIGVRLTNLQHEMARMVFDQYQPPYIVHIDNRWYDMMEPCEGEGRLGRG